MGARLVSFTGPAKGSPNLMDPSHTEWAYSVKHSERRKNALAFLSKELQDANLTEWSSALSIPPPDSSSGGPTSEPTTSSSADLRIMSLQGLRMSMMLYNIVPVGYRTSCELTSPEFFSYSEIRRSAGLRASGGLTNSEGIILGQPAKGWKRLIYASLLITPPTSCGGSLISHEFSS